ncbi:TEA domain-containing protein [Salix suchowensis]|nr:TEA domain-containing protein [Salix suchowensis]
MPFWKGDLLPPLKKRSDLPRFCVGQSDRRCLSYASQPDLEYCIESDERSEWHRSLARTHREGLCPRYASLAASSPLSDSRCPGLREYWHSPFATYSRGRSRYRNQFLVEHLAKAGITRSKKQVASHIQVLRNMWKGEPGMTPLSFGVYRLDLISCPYTEFHLVAGGEELADSSPLPPTKQDERAVDHHGLWSFDWNECDSSNTSPNYSPDVKHECSPPLLPHLSPGSASSPSLSSQDSSPNSIPSQLDFQYQLSHGYPDLQTASSYAQPPFSDNAYHTSGTNDIANRVTAFYLVATGAQPFMVNFDSYVPPAELPGPSWEMKTKLYMTPFDCISVEPEGFTGSVMLASPLAQGHALLKYSVASNVSFKNTGHYTPRRRIP